jgi:hypothetical protein
VADVATATARRILPASLNSTIGAPFQWLPDGSGFLARQVPAGRGPGSAGAARAHGPAGAGEPGRTSPGRTYQDLLQTPHDERLFDYYFTLQLVRVPLAGGAPTPLGTAGCHRGRQRVAGRAVRAGDESREAVQLRGSREPLPQPHPGAGHDGREVKRVADIPLTDDLPTAFDAVAAARATWSGARTRRPPSSGWRRRTGATRAGRPPCATASSCWTPPSPRSRPAGWTWTSASPACAWGTNDFALVTSRWWNTRWERRYAASPANPSAAPRKLADRTYDDRYGDPGSPVYTSTSTGHPVMLTTEDGRAIFLAGQGASPKGLYPFLDRMEIATAATRRLWRAEDPHFETVSTVLDRSGTRILTRRESLTEAPNFFIRTLPGGAAQAVTRFTDPAPQLAGVQRQLITYKRADGVDLSGTLYLPPATTRGATARSRC